MATKEQVQRYKEKYGESIYRKMVADSVKEWRRKNPEKNKRSRDKWNKKNRTKYQREYRLKKKMLA